MWRLRDTVHPVLTDEGGALLDEHTGRWTSLTPTAATALRFLLDAGAEQAAALYADRYGIDRPRAVRDVEGVADTLSAAGLAGGGVRARRRRGWRWSR